jgi:hypothetical protein
MARTGKYRNVRTTIDGIVFDSKREAERYNTLRLLTLAGKIRDLQTKVPACKFPLHVNNHLICHYVADFLYYDVETQQRVVEDTKGFRTRDYKLKKKLMKAIHGIDILET